MIKRTIEISRESVHLATELDQLKLIRHEPESGILASIPCEDIGLVVVDQQGTTYSHAALSRLIEFGAAVLICGRDHLPAGMLLPFPTHTEVVWRLRDQLDVAKPVRKQLWKQIVVAKVRAQAENLPNYSDAQRRLLNLAHDVKSGDPTNVEAQAAKIYWSAWLRAPESRNGGPSCHANGDSHSTTPSPDRPAPSEFHRNPDSKDPINGMLNYGYAVVRAAIARALVSAGLHPALGIQHANRSNAFCLADDLLEPMRPWVDRLVRDLHQEGLAELGRDAKTRLLKLLTMTVRIDGQTGPLMVALHRVVASLVRCFDGAEKKLLLPEPCLGRE